MMTISEIYDFFSERSKLRRWILVAVSIILMCLVATLHFSEDISDFLPLGTKEREEMGIYQNISGAERLFILFSNPGDADRTVSAIESYLSFLDENDTEQWCGDIVGEIDMDTIAEVSDFVYDNIPYFITDADIQRMDSLLSEPGYIGRALANDRNALLFPSSPLVTGAITHDPLGLFSPVLTRMQSSGSQIGFEMYDGHIFTPDMSRAVVMLDSPFGSSETENNTKLLKLLENASAAMQTDFPDVKADIIGGPAIAVGNSSRIKKDSILAIALSAVLIILLLAYSVDSVKNIFLIFLSVGWGLLFALGGMAVFSNSVSIIVIGISSVILGIAINYPLHLIMHTAHQSDMKTAMSEIVSPLVVGNITTVGAFLALVPLKSTALRDLGLFASLLLIGTILFVLLFLPHYVSHRKDIRHRSMLLDRISGFSPEKSRVFVIAVVVITAILSYFSLQTGFDTNMSHINYMTDSQKADMQYFEDMLTKDTTHTAQTLYVYGKGNSFDEALSSNAHHSSVIDSLAASGIVARQNCADAFIVPKDEQARRLELWRDFADRHKDELTSSLKQAASDAGFMPSAFNDFIALVENAGNLAPEEFKFFEPLTKTVFVQNFTESEDGKTKYAVTALNVEPEYMEKAKSALGSDSFDVSGMNEAMTSSLSDNFNYIGWVCSLIVFFFLWFSFGRIELAMISFLPMAVSWIWILGLMSMLGIKFNIVNIILATFIFGQGDDYTIFITEGCQYEYSRRKPILRSYKSSIFQSAAIMFVGIGTLIVARHPAMRSLAEVTIIGMFSVVLMAYLIPPLMFRWLTVKNGKPRRHPVTLRTIFFGTPNDLRSAVEGRYIYKGKGVERTVRRNLKDKGKEMMEMETPQSKQIETVDDGYGELSLLLALSHKDLKVVAHIADDERRNIAEVAAGGIADNIEYKN